MPYNLLYTRNRTDDAAFDVTDIPVNESSVMIEVISFISKFRREFGRVCPIVSDGFASFEQSQVRSLSFAKNRLAFSDYPPPYFLRFYPRYNVSKFAVSVYVGNPGPLNPYKTINNLSFRYRLISGRIDVSVDGGVTSTFSIFSGSIAGFLLGGPSQRIYAKLVDGRHYWVKEGNWATATSITSAAYEAAKILPFVNL